MIHSNISASVVLAALLIAGRPEAAAAVHPCATAAAEQARKLIAFHLGPQPGSSHRIEIDPSVTELAPIPNPANAEQMFDVLQLWAYVYKGQYRLRFIYARSPEECLLMGQEILEYASL